MLNTFIIEGKLIRKPELEETTRGIKFTKIFVECERPYRNSVGEFDKDTFQIEVWRGMAEIICEGSNVGDFVAVQGRMQGTVLENSEGKPYIKYDFVAEKVSFLV